MEIEETPFPIKRDISSISLESNESMYYQSTNSCDNDFESRINRYLDDLGLKICDPNLKEENYYQQKKSKIFEQKTKRNSRQSLNLSISSINESYDLEDLDDIQEKQQTALPLQQKAIKKQRKMSDISLNNFNGINSNLMQRRKMSVSEISNLEGNDLLNRRIKQLKKTSM
ncbi:hypothetical protein PPERSA_00480 [Pseudocohnilembus persalinus]|uniref:Uncharacterized protein n=1 Tax=Pseudocohnilembus persalinus TaxID=266149 RepID=A0A0V0QI33_PSEPJ|nr:hypothetical protein PPERSA_00480 [Pseudocohnilembus persalinus]|eukprot:KRX01858.1 hypothetical protein PPERSA_00480 [Pseudocohnilembus persalinus]